jgi:hypothetical protein
MYHGKNKTEWQHTSSMLAIIANIIHDGKKGSAPGPDDFNPYVLAEKKKQKPIKQDISILKKVFIDKKI